MTSASILLHGGAAVICAACAAYILAIGRGAAVWWLAAAAGAAGLWSASVALTPAAPLHGVAGGLEVLCLATWCAALLYHFRRVAGRRGRVIGLIFGGCAIVATAVALLLSGILDAAAPVARLILALLVVVLAENLFRTADEATRWHVALPAIALGGLAAFDLALYADAALSRSFSTPLIDARAALTALAMPLLAVAALREGRWRRPPVSRQVVFHGATLIFAGIFLLGVGALGEVLRRLDLEWGATAQARMIAAALMLLAVAATTRSLRSRLRNLLAEHFHATRYDYRTEWLRCVGTLSASADGAPAEHRAIRAIADAVDSPGGVLLRDDGGGAGLRWAGSWNMPAEHLMLSADLPLFAGDTARVLDPADTTTAELRGAYGPLWLAVPLPHDGGLAGAVFLAPPRAPFRLDREALELLRTLAHEVAMFLAERRAAERLVDERRVQDYAKRFAFVAHDVKTVSSQLSLLLANAEEHIADMLVTVRSAAGRINSLIARLGQPGDVPASGREEVVAPLDRLRQLAAGKPYPVRLEADTPAPLAAIAPSRFDTALGHLMNNAAEASPPGEPVHVRVAREGERVVVEVTDHGPGMAPEFIRDELFRPLSTSKRGGSGIGAWQARELLREAGGDLAVCSRLGAGTTMRVLLPCQGSATA